MSFLAVCDPNWASDAGGGGKGAQEHYALAGVEAIAWSMRTSPPWVDVGPGLLWMWATTLALCSGDAHALARALGLRVCAGWVWAKVDDAGCGFERREPDDCHPDGWFAIPTFRAPRRMGLGQWQRCEHEHLLLCRRGGVSVPPPESRPRSMIYAPRAEHSAKPDAAWAVIETVSHAVMPGVVGCEWNARVCRAGWAAFGRLDGEDAPLRWVRP